MVVLLREAKAKGAARVEELEGRQRASSVSDPAGLCGVLIPATDDAGWLPQRTERSGLNPNNSDFFPDSFVQILTPSAR